MGKFLTNKTQKNAGVLYLDFASHADWYFSFSAVSHNDALSARYSEQETKGCDYFGTGSQ
jgi:hypothetical protein